MIDWERRRRNIKILCAANNVNATQVARAQDMSPNTLTKFLNSDDPQRALSPKSLALVLDYFGLSDEADLDTNNPLNDPRTSLRRIVSELPEEEAIKLDRELKARYGL